MSGKQIVVAQSKNNPNFIQNQTVVVNDDTIYFNVVLNNNTNVSQQANFTILLPVTNFLKPGAVYDVAIDRFSLDGSSLPIFIFPPVGPDSFYVTLTYSTYVGQSIVSFNSVIDTGPNTLYAGGVYSYQEFALQINQAFITAFTILNGPTQANGALNATAAPFLVFNTSSQTYTLWADSAYYDETLSTPISVFMNNNLYFMFNNFLVESVSEYNVNYQDFRISILNLNGTNTQNVGGVETFTAVGLVTTKSIVGGVNYYLMSQEYSNLGTMQAVQKLSISSKNLGITPELTTGVNTTASLVNTNFSSSQIPINNVISDMIGNFGDNGSQWRSLLTYNPTYRRYHNRTPTSISNIIDLTCTWQDSTNTDYPFYIEKNKNMSAKFVFKERKN